MRVKNDVAQDKRLLVFDTPVSRGMLVEYPDVEVIVYPDQSIANKWKVSVIPKSHDSFDSRVYFPAEWAGLHGEELQAKSGISDLQFCHKGRFLCVANSKESAIKAAKQAK
jgi:uncharacterized UPF0160 family protein